jgi:hypothetical protein
MKNYKENHEELNWPWVESPFFNELIKHQELTDEQKELAIKFNKDGYAVIDLNLTDEEIERCKTDVNFLNNKDDANIQNPRYHYSQGKRVFEAWKECESLLSLAVHPKVTDTLKMLYKREPYPFQTITFNYGSNQPLHSDTIHFDSMPHRWLSAVWVALEDMTMDNGSLVYVPGSHKMPIFDFYDLKLKCANFDDQFESYTEYEEFIRQLVAVGKLETKPLICKKGQAFIWSANLIHGGDIIRDPNSTRYSQVTHYYYDDCDVYYSPMFSEVWKGKFAEKDLTNKNIREHKIVKG